MSLDSLALVSNAQSRRSSSWDRTGGNVDCVTVVAPGESVVLLDAEGPGKVTHIWMTFMEFATDHRTVLRDMVLRMTWEGSEVPSVEVPLGDFFGLGHGLPSPFYANRNFQVAALPCTVGGNERALNSYWPMPFHKSARIEIYNNGARSLKQLYFHVDYELGPQPPESALFHAEFRQALELPGQVTDPDYVNLHGEENYVLFEAEGRGHYAGCFFYVDSGGDAWWGEGDDMIFIDGDTLPTIIGTGSEDYFNDAWCMHKSFTLPWYGCPLLARRPDGGSYTSMYRFHGPDPIRFRKSIRMTIERWWDSDKTNNISSVAFWYQQQPAGTRPPLPKGAANHPVLHPVEPKDCYLLSRRNAVNVSSLEEPLRTAGLDVKMATVLGQEFLTDGGAILVASHGKAVTIPVPVPEDGLYRLEVKPVYGLIEEEIRLGLPGNPEVPVRGEKFLRENDGPFVSLGSVPSVDKTLPLTLRGASHVPIHLIAYRKLD